MSSLPIRFALAATPQAAADAVSELRNILARAQDCDLEPVFVPSYNALYDSIHLHDADAAWCPPLVARDLQRDGAADARLAIVRNGSRSYFSAIVGSPSLHAPSDIKRFGWVSRMSAAGYLVPRSYLASIGVAHNLRACSQEVGHVGLATAAEAQQIDWGLDPDAKRTYPLDRRRVAGD